MKHPCPTCGREEEAALLRSGKVCCEACNTVFAPIQAGRIHSPRTSPARVPKEEPPTRRLPRPDGSPPTTRRVSIAGKLAARDRKRHLTSAIVIGVCTLLMAGLGGVLMFVAAKQRAHRQVVAPEPAEATVEPEPGDEPEPPDGSNRPKKPTEFPEFDDIKALTDEHVAAGQFAQARTAWETFLRRNDWRFRGLDEELAQRIVSTAKREIAGLGERIRIEDAARAEALRVMDERNAQAVADQWAAFEKQFAAAGGGLNAVEFLQRNAGSLVEENRLKAVEGILPILNELTLAYWTEAESLRPRGEAVPDRVVLSSGVAQTGRIVEETADHVRLQLSRGGVVTHRREECERVEFGDQDKREADLSEARLQMHHALLVAYTGRLRDRIRAVIARDYAAAPAPKVEIGWACMECVLSGFLECKSCEGGGFIEYECGACAPADGSTFASCGSCRGSGFARHQPLGTVVLEPVVHEGAECRNCQGRGYTKYRRLDEREGQKVKCTVCDGLGRRRTFGDPVEMKMFACDEKGHSLLSVGAGKRCRILYNKLKRDFSTWSRAWDGKRLTFDGRYWSVHDEADFKREVAVMFERIEEYAQCKDGRVPCTDPIHGLKCPRCQGTRVERTGCAACDGSGGGECRSCAGQGLTLDTLPLVEGNPAAGRYETELIRKLK